MKDKSLGGALYFATFIDNVLSKLQCFALESKDKVFEIFKSFHANSRRQSGRKVKCIRGDNGAKYWDQFEQYCHDHDIKLERSVPKQLSTMVWLKE